LLYTYSEGVHHMKRIAIVLVISLLSLVGCSIMDQADAEKVVLEISKLVDKGNALSNRLSASVDNVAMDTAVNTLNISLQNGNVDKEALNKVLELTKKQKESSEKERKGLQEIKAQIPAVQAKTANLSENRKKMADQTLADLQTLTENELKMKDIEIEMFELNLKYYEAIGQGKEPAEDNYEQLEGESKKLQTQLESDLKKFNDSWNAFHKDVRGTDTKKPIGE
jgi:CRISPR/Cas system CSM-associated protein Csm2 small subunit